MKNGGQDDDVVTAARAKLERARLELDREAQRLRKAEAEVEAFASQLGAVDPDGPAFAKIVGQREVARALVSALEVRIETAQTQLARAQGAVEEIERDVRRARVERIEAELREKDASITAACIAFRSHLIAEIAAARALADAAAAIDPRPWSASPRNSKWAGITADEAMLVAAGAVGALR